RRRTSNASSTASAAAIAAVCDVPPVTARGMSVARTRAATPQWVAPVANVMVHGMPRLPARSTAWMVTARTAAGTAIVCAAPAAPGAGGAVADGTPSIVTR